jgi:2-polyprenyl-6-methoxyphenol hydroxylase-like FAD-dependent oxidoreductase
MIGAGNVLVTAPILDGDSAGAPLHNNNLFRLYLGVPETPPRAPDAEYLQAILDARGPGSHLKTHPVPQIAKVMDNSRYRSELALADRYVHPAEGGAYILLVGDAAHKHSPAGGQGMNMGICDGVALAQTIEEHRKSAVDAEKSAHGAAQIMDAYSTRRGSVAAQVIDMVERIGEVENGGQGWGPYLRAAVLWAVFKLPFVHGLVARQLSGLGHSKKL